MENKEIYNYRLKMEILAVTRNIITIICFTILSIIFHHWYIIFFSIVFWASIDDVDDKNE